MRGRFRIISLLLLIFAGFCLPAQTNDEVELETGAEEELLPEPPGSLIDPVFPALKTSLVQFEAEEAVSTNFAKTTTLDYSASGYRTLQLNRYTGLFGGAAFYAEYVFYVEEPGEYALYYGGTPPGPEDEVYPSYTSPFSYSIDQGEMVPVHHEQVTVIERYMPNYYWIRFGTAGLDAGVHRLRVEVTEKRKYDGKYLFYLDSFLLIDTERFDRTAGVPKVFPRDLDAGNNIDTFLKTVNDYRYLISVEPENVDYYIEFSLIYAVIGDYLNALRNVNKAMLLDPENAEAKRLAAKYRLWKGEADEALKMYSVLLEMRPEQREVWAEAGKVAAWVGRYDDSIDYYSRALEYFPNDLNLSVNRAITYLWQSREREADEILEAVETAVAGDVERTLELGEILVANGYPDRAVMLYAQSIKRNPEYLELYLKLVQAYAEAGKAEKSTAVYEQIGERFTPSDRLDSLSTSFSIEERMKEDVIQGFTDALAENPDNLALREQLVQAYFWNGRRKKAIEEYLNIIVNYAYNSLSNFDRRSAELFELTDSLSVFKRRYTEIPSEIEARRSELESALAVYTNALKAFEKFDQKTQRAKDAGNAPPEPEGVHPKIALSDAESALADTVALASEYRRLVSSFLQSSEDLVSRRDRIVTEEQASRDAFVRLVADSGWRWDRTQTIEELETVSRSGFVLADYVLGRIYSIHGEYSSAGPLLDTVASSGDAPAGYAAIQNSLWRGDPAGTVDVLAFSDYAPYLDELASLVKKLGLAPAPVADIYTDATLSEVQSVLASLDELESDLKLHIQVIDETLNVFQGITRSRFERTIYAHQQETYLLRFELADYYLLEGDYAETDEQARESYAAAAEQLRLVLDIEPLNTSAVYKIGILYDRLGRWKRAMDSYAEVYEADPRFENVAAYYNQLARRHADTAYIQLQLTADAARIGQKSTLALGNEFSSAIGLRTRAETETVRMYQDFEDGVEPWLYQVHGFGFAVPLTIQALGLSLTPAAGVRLCSSLIDDGITERVKALNPLYVAASYEIEPELGGDLLLETEYVSVTGTYRYGRYQDSFKPGAERLISHSAAASARLDFGIFNWELLQYSSARFTGDFDLLFNATGQVNTLYGVTEKLEFVFHLADSPWTNFTVSQLLEFGGSRSPGAGDYYAPEGNLQISGGLGIATWLAVTNDTTVGLIFNVTPGVLVYGLTGSNDDAPAGNGDVVPEVPETRIQTGADLRVELTVADVTYFAAAQLSGSAAELPGLDYWSASVNLGVNARLPRLLSE